MSVLLAAAAFRCSPAAYNYFGVSPMSLGGGTLPGLTLDAGQGQLYQGGLWGTCHLRLH